MEEAIEFIFLVAGVDIGSVLGNVVYAYLQGGQ